MTELLVLLGGKNSLWPQNYLKEWGVKKNYQAPVGEGVLLTNLMDEEK